MKRKSYKIGIGICVALLLMTLSRFSLPHASAQYSQAFKFVPSSDGYLERGQDPGDANADPNVAYDNVWAASVADTLYNDFSNDIASQVCTYQGGWLAFSFDRIGLFFDTSSLNQTVTGAILSVCTYSSSSDFGPYNLILQTGSGLQSPISVYDYNQGLYSGNYGSVGSENFTDNSYTNITITDLSMIKPTGTTGIMLRIDADVEGNHTGWNQDQGIGYSMYSSRSASPPILYVFTGTEITYASSTSTTTVSTVSTVTTTSTDVVTTVLMTDSTSTTTTDFATTDLTTTSASAVTTVFSLTSLTTTSACTTITNWTTTTVETDSTTTEVSTFTTGAITNTTTTSITTLLSSITEPGGFNGNITMGATILVVVAWLGILYINRKAIITFLKRKKN